MEVEKLAEPLSTGICVRVPEMESEKVMLPVDAAGVTDAVRAIAVP